MKWCPAIGSQKVRTKPDSVIMALVSHCSWVDRFALDELPNTLELALLASGQEPYLDISFPRHHILDRSSQRALINAWLMITYMLLAGSASARVVYSV